ncbi:hypothetical protein ACQEV2_42590 [Streptomyces sp. CA-251387]
MSETATEAPESTRVFDELMAEVTASAGTFGHREHVHHWYTSPPKRPSRR